MMKQIMQMMRWIQVEWGISPEMQTQIFTTLFIIIVIATIYRFIRKILYRTIESSKTYYRTKKIVGYLFVGIAFLMVGRVWFQGIKFLTTFLGLFSAGVAIAMKDLIMNIAGWFYIIWRGPFRVGERVEISGVSGDIIDIQLFKFTLMEIGNWINADQATGRIVHIPNNHIFKNPLFNYSMGIPYVWDEIPIYVTYESNWKKAKRILEDIANKYGESISEQAGQSIKEASRKYMIYDAKLQPGVYTSIHNKNSIALTVRYMCGYRNRRNCSERIYEDILDKFAEHSDIAFAYPTERVYNRATEGID